MKSKLLLALLFTVLPLVANAAEYKLVKGSQYALCRDLKRNLQTFRDATPMVCGVRFHPQFKKFGLPDWQPMDAAKHLNLFQQAYVVSHLGIGGQPRAQSVKEWKSKKSELLRKIEQDKIHLAESRFDLDNDGDTETVFKIDDIGGCDVQRVLKSYGRAYDPSLYVRDEKTGKLSERYVYLATTFSSAHPFFYQHKTFFSLAHHKALSKDDWVLNVEEPDVLESNPKRPVYSHVVCKYDYLTESNNDDA